MPAVLLMNHMHTSVLRRQSIENLACAIAAAVVDDN